ncbi:hypothetical protein KAFR_0A02990 [Kazachstania africana CBS 2517]|uniref:Replication termination factor 2 n=1 Tax=Kazachstania africana (strain ATCC 22294 / BCRC 22015 / CBS 2517 / CECT 1963 / NBRC 1671 / NRRL Y-8276) TaxID=1071382 RepID=H2AMY4_KAZAF|nr:hypothetical protein KAFR_0A02990 [Kazachstania africana CBS 2517]CCF55734.1 hypothetical protein KAFR_0A02990 [Kazachstania africana CBS 2517]
MGNDGGSINKHSNLKLSLGREDEKINDEDLSQFNTTSRWKYCRLSNKQLELPIVSDYKGNLYNKEAILEWLLSQKKNEYTHSQIEQLKHIRKLNDVVELHNLEEIKVGKEVASLKCSFGEDVFGSNSKTFIYLAKCGDVLPISTVKIQSNGNKCPACAKKFEPIDIIQLNPTSKLDLDKLEKRYKDLQINGFYHNGMQKKRKLKASTSETIASKKRRRTLLP